MAGARKKRSRADSDALADLAARANLGPKSAVMLFDSGVTSYAKLEKLGSVAAFVKVRSSGSPASLNLLWALEGALTGTHWRIVARDRRESLLFALDDLERAPRRHR